jgi:two-component system, NarL family, nitrate/nitrite response regulator NarL
LVERLLNVSKSEVTIDKSLVGRLAHALCHDSVPQSVQEAKFTDREQEILACIVDGLSNKLIAHKLGISEGTVKVHVKNILRKLNLRSRLEIAVWAFNQNLRSAAKRLS